MLTESDIKLMERFLVPYRKLPEILDTHGAKISRDLKTYFDPRLASIEREQCEMKRSLQAGHRRFLKNDKEIDQIKTTCSNRHPDAPAPDPIAEIDQRGEEELREIYWTRKKILAYSGIGIAIVTAIVIGAITIIAVI